MIRSFSCKHQDYQRNIYDHITLDKVSSCSSLIIFFFFSSRRRHTRSLRDWSSDVCSSDLRCSRGTDSPRPTPVVTYRRVCSPRTPFPNDRLAVGSWGFLRGNPEPTAGRSEERRVGKECRYRWWAYH